MKTDIHQHVWTWQLVAALSERDQLPFVRSENGLTVLHLAGERPYVIDMHGEAPARRAAQARQDGLDLALICLSSPLGIEALARSQAEPLLDAYHEGALSLGEPFGVWGAIALDGARPQDVDAVLERGCVGLSLPAGALASVDAVAQMHDVLERLEHHGAPLLVHPGPAAPETSLTDPLWWPAMTRYVACQQAAWLAFRAAGRPRHPRLRIAFSMLAGLAPLQHERLLARGGPAAGSPDPLLFYETSSYGPRAASMMADLVGASCLLYGSDRPVVDPAGHSAAGWHDWEIAADAAARLLGRRAPGGADPDRHSPRAPQRRPGAVPGARTLVSR